MSTQHPKAAKPSKILLVDDHPMVREQLTAIINREPDMTVCGEADNNRDAMAAIEKHKPDLAIVDLTLKDSHGLDLIKDIRLAHPDVRTLVVSMHDESLYAERVMRAGAQGYVTKQQATRNILQAIREVLAGQIYLSPQAAGEFIRKFSGQSKHPLVIDQLADRELQVFELLGQGFSTRRIAEHLRLDVKTIDTYRSRIKEKLGLKNGNELVQAAVRWIQTTRK